MTTILSRSVLVAIGALFVAGAAGAGLGCSSDDEGTATPAVPVDGGAASSPLSTTTSSSSSSSSSSGGGALEGDDAGASSSSSSSSSSGAVVSLTPTPGEVSCGSTTCASPGNGDGCCIPHDGDGGACQASCPNEGVVQQEQTLRKNCDDITDCSDGELCCLGSTIGGPSDRLRFVSASCNSQIAATHCIGHYGTSGMGKAQLCLSDEECGPGVKCNPKTCGAFQLYVCGSPADCQ